MRNSRFIGLSFAAVVVVAAVITLSPPLSGRDRIVVTKSVVAKPISFSVENAQADGVKWRNPESDPFEYSVRNEISEGKGTRFRILLRHDEWRIGAIDNNDVKIKSIKDDKGKSLDGLFSGVKVIANQPEGTHHAIVDVFTKFRPGKGAKSIALTGTATVKANRKRKQLRSKAFEIHADMGKVPIKLGEHELTVEWEGERRGLPEIELNYEGSMSFINQLEFQTLSGNVIAHNDSGRGTSSSGGRLIRESRDYTLQAPVRQIVIAADVWTDTIEKKVPLRLKFDLNLGTDKEKKKKEKKPKPDPETP